VDNHGFFYVRIKRFKNEKSIIAIYPVRKGVVSTGAKEKVKKQRVAAYYRFSTGTEEQNSSYEA